jgi:signal transduction histidine kinase
VRDANGALVAIEGIARDVTGRKRRELDRESALALEHEARARAEAAARAREDLLAMVSHDLRTPLNSVVLGARVAADAIARGEQGALVSRRLESIAHAADRMGRLVEQLLDAASVEAGRITLAPEPVHVEALVRDALELVGEHAAEKRVSLRAACPQPVAVECDRERVLQVLGNLLGNAIKFTPAGGRVDVHVEAEPAWAKISVVDTGPGIPEHQLPCIFDRYWTGRLQRTSGTGLGLFIAKGIVEAHAGRLSVDSHVGRGTTFTFTLPRVRRAMPAQ